MRMAESVERIEKMLEVGIVDENNAAVNDADGNALLLKRAINPQQCVVFFFQYFTRMMNISNKGIAVTD